MLMSFSQVFVQPHCGHLTSANTELVTLVVCKGTVRGKKGFITKVNQVYL